MTILHLFRKPTTHRSWLAVAFLVTLVSSLVLFVPQAEATATLDEGIIAAPQPQNPFFNGDLTVEKGQTLEGDIVVYGGVTIEKEGVITGDLVVYGGDVEIKKQGKILGDLAAFGSDIEIDGEVGGDVASANGTVSLGKDALIHGDVSVLAGEVERHREAQVLGSVVQGPNINIQMPSLPGLPSINLDGEVQTEIEIARDSAERGFFGWLIGGVLRLFFALLLAVVLAAIVGIFTTLRTEFVEKSAAAVKEQFALNFGIGLVTNVLLLVVTTFLIATFCLAIIAIIPMLGLFVLGLLSWTVLSLVVGRRVVRYANISTKSATTAAMGALAMALPIALLWSFGGCFRFIAFLCLLLISSAGSGAFILPWLRRFAGKPKDDTHSALTGDLAPKSDPERGVQGEGADVDPSVEASMADSDNAIVANATPKAEQDDFTRINGIGPTFSRRLVAANVRTFAQLAALSADEVSAILGWSAERVVRDKLIEQARNLAAER